MGHCHDDCHDECWKEHHCHDHDCLECDHDCHMCDDYDGHRCHRKCRPKEEQVMKKEDVLTLWEILKKTFAPILHKHDAADIESGILPVDRGGTGANNAEGARENLDAAKTDHKHDVDDVDGAAKDDHTHAVDNALSDTSANPVENRVIKAALDAIGRRIDGVIASIEALAESVTQWLAGKSDVGHTHNLNSGDVTGILPVTKGGTGTDSEDKLVRKVMSVATVDQSDPRDNPDNQTFTNDGFVFFNRYGGASAEGSGMSGHSSGSQKWEWDGVNCLTGGYHLVSGHIIVKSNVQKALTLALAEMRPGETTPSKSSFIARAMETCEANQAHTLTIPPQLVAVDEGSTLKLWLAIPTGGASATVALDSNSAASLTVMRFAPGVIS